MFNLCPPSTHMKLAVYRVEVLIFFCLFNFFISVELTTVPKGRDSRETRGSTEHIALKVVPDQVWRSSPEQISLGSQKQNLQELGPPLLGQKCHLQRWRDARLSIPTFQTPIMGTMRICGTPPGLTKTRHLTHAVFSFYFPYHLKYTLFTKSNPFSPMIWLSLKRLWSIPPFSLLYTNISRNPARKEDKNNCSAFILI